MAEYLIQDTTLDAIADAINAKTGGSSAMTPAEMVTAIAAIPSGGGGQQKVLLASGTYTQASQASFMSIPISFSGVATEGAIIGEPIADTAHTYATYILNDIQGNDDDVFLVVYLAGSPNICMNVAQTAGNVKVRGYTNNALESSRIYMYQNGSSYPILAGTYNWYVWGYVE